MDRKNYVQLSPKKYEQRLSSFGKKVLSELMKQWKQALVQNDNDYAHHSFPAQNKRVLTFNNDSVVDTPYTPPPSLILSTPGAQIYMEEDPFNMDLINNTVPKKYEPIEIVNTVPKNNDNDDFLHPDIAFNNNLLSNKNCDIDGFDFPLVEETCNKNTSNNNSKDIHWDDMLDSELIVTMTANEEESKESNVDKMFNIRFPNENVTISNNIINGNKHNNDMESLSHVTIKSEKRKIKKSAEPKAKKVRSDGNVRENQQKDSVKPSNIKNNFRKQKYTKSVKNWLDNVELHNPVDDDLGNIKSTTDNKRNMNREKNKSNVENIDQNAPSDKIPIRHDQKIAINKTIKTTKKIIQAQLANKDGVMKFSKPKQNDEEIKKRAEVTQTITKEAKEKKVKKFVAPIKSQIPVKDVSYEIRTLNEENIEDHSENLRNIKNKEIFVVLIYSNGFCQLNSHYTDDTCAPDGVIINNDDLFYCFKSSGQKLKETLNHLLENNKVVCYGGRGVLIYLATHLQMEINSIVMRDAEIGATLLDPDNSPENFTDLQKLVSFTAPFTIATECTLQKSAWYMSLLKECWAKLYGMLVDDSLWQVFEDIEMKLLPIIADMERRGVSIDLVKLNEMEEVLVTRMKIVEQQCYKAAGKAFLINSAVQVRAILYDELQLDTQCNVVVRETICKGAKSTSETMLRSLVSVHPLPKLILEYRHLHKAHATFLTGIAQHVKGGVVRPTWVQTAAATGRIASNNPNLQAIPKTPFSLVMFPNVDDDASTQLLFRSVYVPREGHSFLAADFKHAECRLFAHAAADCGLLAALAACDLFKVLAAQWLKKPEADVVSEERERTKRLVYASLYGAGTRKLMEILDVDYQQALQVAASFNRTFPSLKSFGRDVVSQCGAARGRLATLCGRVRRFHNITSEDFNLKSHAERQAVNFIVQAIIKQVMEGCGQLCGMSVSLPVAVSVGSDWANMRPYAEGGTS